MKTNIKFGTDGWRAIIARDFTFDNVRRVAGAVAHYLTTQIKKNPLVTIGYDTRFQSKAFAETFAEVLSKHGCSVIISDTFLSTPGVSYAVRLKKADGGIVISASHNPPEFNGIKFKTSDSCSAPETVTKQFEDYLASENNDAAAAQPGSVTTEKLTAPYLKYLKSYIDFKAIKNKSFKVVIDTMHGAGAGYIEKILEGTKLRKLFIHERPDPFFGGMHPEPIEEYLSGLKNSVKQNSANIGLATDGDADRIGVVDDNGRYLPPHHVFPLLLYYLCKYKGMKGKVVQTISLGYLSERIAKDFNLPWEETPIGFKYIADRIIESRPDFGGVRNSGNDPAGRNPAITGSTADTSHGGMRENVLIGGEESGGYGYGNYLPERDGVLNSLMLIEMLAATGKPVSALLDEIQKKYGKSVFLRTDFVNPGIPKDEFVSKLKSTAPSAICGLKVKEIKDYDGIEFVLQDDSWLLLRPSGTEPKIRVYSETEALAKTKALLAWGDKAVRRLTVDR